MCKYLQIFVWGIPAVISICMFHPHSIWRGKYFVLLILSLWSQAMYYCYKVFCFLFFYKSSVANWQCKSLNHGFGFFFFFCFLPPEEMEGEFCTTSCMQSVSNLYCWASPLGVSGRVTPKYFCPMGNDRCFSYTAAMIGFCLKTIILSPHICNYNVKDL